MFYPTRQPAVIAFYYEQGIEFDLATHEHRTLLLDYREELLSEDPLRIRITIPVENEELRLTYDERMDVVAMSRTKRTRRRRRVNPPETTSEPAGDDE